MSQQYRRQEFGVDAGSDAGVGAGAGTGAGANGAGAAEVDVESALSLLGDEYAQAILAVLREGPATATELTERCPGSKVTIYRRLNDLVDAGLVTERPQIRPDGNHCKVYRLAVDEVTVTLTLTDDGLDAEIGS